MSNVNILKRLRTDLNGLLRSINVFEPEDSAVGLLASEFVTNQSNFTHDKSDEGLRLLCLNLDGQLRFSLIDTDTSSPSYGYLHAALYVLAELIRVLGE